SNASCRTAARPFTVRHARNRGTVSFWNKLKPDEPFISGQEVMPARYLQKIPPAVRAWCLVSVAANFVIALAFTPVFRHAGPFVASLLFSVFPLSLLFFWRSFALQMDGIYDRAAETQSIFVIRINIDLQWCAISLCAGATVMLCVLLTVLWFGP